MGCILAMVVFVRCLTLGEYETFPRSLLMTERQRALAPSWTAPCRRRAPAFYNGPICARTRGAVVHVEARDPDGDGDLHVVLLSGWSLRIVKVPKAAGPEAPSLGNVVEAAGWTTRGASGRREVVATRLDVTGPLGL